MKLDKHTTEEDFPLSGGNEPDIKFTPLQVISIALLIIAVAVATMWSKGYF